MAKMRPWMRGRWYETYPPQLEELRLLRAQLITNIREESKKFHFFFHFFLEVVAQFKIMHYFCTAFRKK